jgi:hypothetical protein
MPGNSRFSHDWEAARDFYIESGLSNGVTLQKVAERFDIPYQSVRRRAGKERWRLTRAEINK